MAYFRKRHPGHIRQVFREFVSLMCKWRLVGRKTVAVDSTKYRAKNSKKNNYNQEKIKRQLACIAYKVSEYIEEMNDIDRKEKTKAKDIRRLFELTKDKEKMQGRRRQHKALQKGLASSEDTEISRLGTLVMRKRIISLYSFGSSSFITKTDLHP